MATGVVSRGVGRKNDFGKAVSRFLSSSDTRTCAEGEDHLSERSIPGTCSAFAEHGAGRSEVPYLALHPMGFSVPPRLLSERWALTPPFHPYPHRSLPRFPLAQRRPLAVCSLWHCPSGCLAASLPACISSAAAEKLRGIAPCGDRTFLPWLSPGAIFRLSKIEESLATNNALRKERSAALNKTKGSQQAHPQNGLRIEN